MSGVDDDGVDDAVALTVWLFAHDCGAQRAAPALARRAHDVRIVDAAVVAWRPGQLRPEAWQDQDLAGVDRLSGAFWGLLVSVLFLLPLARDHEAPEAVAGALDVIGVDDGTASALRQAIGPGTSALFVLSAADQVARLGPAMVPSGGQQVATITLAADRQHRLFAAFADQP